MVEGLRRAVFLDRDGVLNRCVVENGRPYPPKSLEDLEILPGVAETLQRFRDAGDQLGHGPEIRGVNNGIPIFLRPQIRNRLNCSN